MPSSMDMLSKLDQALLGPERVGGFPHLFHQSNSLLFQRGNLHACVVGPYILLYINHPLIRF